MQIGYSKEAMKYIPEVEPEPDEIAAIEAGKRSIKEEGTVPHDAIDWD